MITGRPFISPRVQLLATIWLLATPDSYSFTLFNQENKIILHIAIGKTSLSHCVRRVVLILCKMSIDVIKWPSIHDMNTITEKFKQISGLKDVVGAIGIFSRDVAVTSQGQDGWPIPENLSFTDIKVFRNSDFWHNVHKNYRYFFLNEEFIIGDKAYPIRKWCLTAYRDNGHLTEPRSPLLSQTRQTIERAFALLKGRFRRLKYLDMARIDLISATILACCVFHNICLQNTDDIENYILEGRENDEARENLERNENERY
ncbi:putative nuclease HARBI1 [Temnothorax nylanderi]|uniref:putative nuclease HARBI1 n=1 Tax=Temnothorax nylanderi TaxID=102681 RepID=UPI003A87097F